MSEFKTNKIIETTESDVKYIIDSILGGKVKYFKIALTNSFYTDIINMNYVEIVIINIEGEYKFYLMSSILFENMERILNTIKPYENSTLPIDITYHFNRIQNLKFPTTSLTYKDVLVYSITDDMVIKHFNGTLAFIDSKLFEVTYKEILEAYNLTMIELYGDF